MVVSRANYLYTYLTLLSLSIQSTKHRVIYGSSTIVRTVSITTASPIPWSIENHRRYFCPVNYAPTVKTVLLCHYVLRNNRQERSFTPSLGNVPPNVVLKILAFAAPIVYHSETKPPLPDGASPGNYSFAELTRLFRSSS